MTEDTDDHISLDLHRVEAFMHFPEDERLQIAWWKSRKRPDIIRAINERNQWPITLDRRTFEVIANTGPDAPTPEEFRRRREWGWMIGVAFDYFVRSRVWHSNQQLPRDKGTPFSVNKFMLHLESLTGGHTVNAVRPVVPGTSDPRPKGRTAFEAARRHLWSAAHYWAAEFNLAGEARFPIPKPTGRLTEFMMLAETYRQTGLTLGVFEKLAPEGQFDSNEIHYDSRFPAFEAVLLPSLLPHEKAKLETYVSDSTIKRHKKDRRPDRV